MRAKEFVVEATIAGASASSWPAYLEKLSNKAQVPSVSLGDNGQMGSNLVIDDVGGIDVINNLKQQLAQAADKVSLINQIKNTQISFNNGAVKNRIGNIFKDAQLKGGGRQQTRIMGLVNEALLGFCMYAKLINRMGDLVAPISSKEVWDVIKKINPQPGSQTISQSVADVSGVVKDSINLDFVVPNDVQMFLVDPNNRSIITQEMGWGINYVNSDLAQKFADILYKNNSIDNITVELSGKEGGKIDVKINVLDERGQATQQFKQLKLSVKLSNSLVGQKGRGSSVDEVYENLKDLFKFFEVDLSGATKQNPQAVIMGAIKDLSAKSGIQKQFVGGINYAYKQVADQLNQRLAQDPNYKNQLGAQLVKMIDYHSTGNDPNIHVIEKGIGDEYKLYSYRNLYNIFQRGLKELEVDYSTGKSEIMPGEEVPRLRFNCTLVMPNGSKSSGELVEIRFRARSGYANHIIEPGKMLKTLAVYRRFVK